MILKIECFHNNYLNHQSLDPSPAGEVPLVLETILACLVVMEVGEEEVEEACHEKTREEKREEKREEM